MLFKGDLETGRGTEREAGYLLNESEQLLSFEVPTKSVLPIVLGSEIGLKRLELLYPHACREKPNLARPTKYPGHMPAYVRNFDWVSLGRDFVDWALGIDTVFERIEDGCVIGFDVTAHKADSQEVQQKLDKLQRMRPLLHQCSIDSVVVLCLETSDFSFNVLPKQHKLKLVSQLDRKVEKLKPGKWARIWEISMK